MKYLILIITALCIDNQAFSQDSIKVRTEIDTFSKANYEGQYDYVFARKEPQKQMLKSGIIGILANGNTELLAYERKISDDISLHFSLNGLKGGGLLSSENSKIVGNTFDTVNDTVYYESKPSLGFSFEPRWYFNMKRDIKNGLIANNFHGSYVGFRTSFETENSPLTNTRFLKDSSAIITGRSEHNYYISNELCFGIQRRILKYQYIDFSFGTGIRTRIRTQIPTDQKQTQWVFNYRLAYGFILFGTSMTKNNVAKCDALRCFEQEKSMLKIGLSNLISQLNERQFTGILSIAYERKIPKTQFSIESSVAIGGNLHTKPDEKVSKSENKFGFVVAIMPRYYSDQKRLIAKGEQADNLSGTYWGLKLDYCKAQRFDNEKIQSSSASLVWGTQQRILQHLNFDWWVGYGALAEKIQAKTDVRAILAMNLSLNLAF
jgi:hypothetical protein